MKRWIVKQFIQISEVTGWPVPKWVRRLLPETEFKAMTGDEQALTRALSTPRTDRPRMPENLKARLEAAAQDTAPVQMPEQQPFPSLSWALAAAALLMLGAVILFRPPASWSPSEERPPLVVEQTDPPVESPTEVEPGDNPGLPADALADDLLVKPLASEKERLAADVTNALQFVAESILPSAYAASVHDSLQSAEQRFIKSI